MATIATFTTVCDLCGTDEGVDSHVISLEQKAPVAVDVCPSCWGPAAEVLAKVMSAGTSKKVADRRVVAARGIKPQKATVTAERPAVQKTAPKKTARKSPAPQSAAPRGTPKKASATNTKVKKAIATRASQSTDTETS